MGTGTGNSLENDDHLVSILHGGLRDLMAELWQICLEAFWLGMQWTRLGSDHRDCIHSVARVNHGQTALAPRAFREQNFTEIFYIRGTGASLSHDAGIPMVLLWTF